jgi:HemY protein
VRYAKLLLGAGKNRKAAAAIEKSWGYSPHPDLLEPYLEACDAPNASARLVAVQRLAKINPHHSDSNLAIASMALDAKIWGEARKFLEATLKQKPSAKVYRLMADLAELSDGNSEESRGWLRQATEANPDPAWVCNPCGHVHMEWAETCGKCGNFSGLVWEMPPHAVMPREILKGSIASILEKPVSELSPPSH